MKAFLSNSGFIVQLSDNDYFPVLRNINSVPLNLAFIAAATNAMINDIPRIPEIEQELFTLKMIDQDLMLPLPDFLVYEVFRKNSEKVKAFIQANNQQFTSLKIITSDFRITTHHKTGVIINQKGIQEVKLLNLKDSHPVQYSRDFIGYYFDLNWQGQVIFKCTKNDIKLKYQFNRIPLLAFKSENSINNQRSRKISAQILSKIVNRKVEVIYL
ncbi:MAG: checkpoint protein HUS1 family protein [Spirochaetes bacterium]|nr:checkpoint protein HUS1 family protein [Spirochaetota bacterium]